MSDASATWTVITGWLTSTEGGIRWAKKILEDILASHASILKEPEPVVKVHELADSSVNFVVRPLVETENYWDVYWDITRPVKDRFDAEGVSIPFPQRDVHVYQTSST